MRIAIVNDLRIVTEALRRVVCSDPQNTIAWTAADGEEAVRRCEQDTPDAILMDLVMPGMNGAEATRQIMRRCPCPILVVTSTVAGNYGLVCEALGHGAYDAVNTPELGRVPLAQAAATVLGKLAKVESIRRRLDGPRERTEQPPHRSPPPPAWASGSALPLVAIGASTGGPHALREILARFPSDLAAAVVVVQHIGAEFAESLVQWLADGSRLRVRAAAPGDRPEAGTVLVASTDDHLVLGRDRTYAYVREPVSNPFRPSADALFESVAQHWAPPSVAALLTGIGRDGAQGLLALRRAGWHTIAQDAQTCVVYGMPRAAVELGAAARVLPLNHIADEILGFLRLKPQSRP